MLQHQPQHGSVRIFLNVVNNAWSSPIWTPASGFFHMYKFVVITSHLSLFRKPNPASEADAVQEKAVCRPSPLVLELTVMLTLSAKLTTCTVGASTWNRRTRARHIVPEPQLSLLVHTGSQDGVVNLKTLRRRGVALTTQTRTWTTTCHWGCPHP